MCFSTGYGYTKAVYLRIYIMPRFSFKMVHLKNDNENGKSWLKIYSRQR